MSSLAVTGNVWSAGVERVANALALLEQRSPGARTDARLGKLKQPRPDDALQRALGKEFPPNAILPAVDYGFASPAELLARSPDPIAPELPVAEFALAGDGGFGYFVPPTGAWGGGGGGFGGGGGSGGNGGGGGGPEPTPPDPFIPPAVPEPGTWLTLILGMGLSAWALRRRVAVQQGSPCAAT